jgi:predicted porin
MRSKFTVATLAAAAALLCATTARADVSLYGTLDMGVDKVERGEGNVSGTVLAAAGAPKQVRHRASPSLTAQSKLGFRGTEQLGGGYAGRFQMEMSLVPDTGNNGGDGRTFGRMAWVGLTTPAGEVRLGRQASAMLAAYDLTTVERLGTTDVTGVGLVLNNLQTYQDNAISYSARLNGWIVYLNASANAGVGEAISVARGSAVGNGTGQILGGGSAGTESTDGRGRALGGMLAYVNDQLSFATAVHQNKFNVPVVAAAPAPVNKIVLFDRLEDYTGVMLAAKYKLPFGTTVGANVHLGQFEEAGNDDPETRSFGLGLTHKTGNVNWVGLASQTQFTNFTRGKNTAFMLGADYNLSPSTALYTRMGSMKDERGSVVGVGSGNLPVAGGPMALLVQLGINEVPLFSGAGIHIGGRTNIVSVGLRHSF